MNDIEIVTLVRRNFQEGIRLHVEQLLVWCAKTDEIQLYFVKFRMQGPTMLSQKALTEPEYLNFKNMEVNEVDIYTFPPGSSPPNMPSIRQNFIAKKASEVVHNKKSANFRAWLHTAL